MPAGILLVPLGLLCSQDWGLSSSLGTVLAHAACQSCEMLEKNVLDMYPTPWFSSTLCISGFYCYYYFPSVFCLWILENWAVCGMNCKWTLFMKGRLHVPHVGGRKGERKTAVIQLENVQDGPDSKFKGSWALVM